MFPLRCVKTVFCSVVNRVDILFFRANQWATVYSLRSSLPRFSPKLVKNSRTKILCLQTIKLSKMKKLVKPPKTPDVPCRPWLLSVKISKNFHKPSRTNQSIVRPSRLFVISRKLLRNSLPLKPPIFLPAGQSISAPLVPKI